LLKGNRTHEIVGCPQVVYERIFANQQANQDKMNKLSSIKSNNAKAKESESDQPTEADPDKTDAGKKNSKKFSSSDSKNSMKTTRSTAAHGPSESASKRKRDDEEDVGESDPDERQLARFPKKTKPSVNPVSEEFEGGSSSDEHVAAEDSDFSYDFEDRLSAPPSPPAKKALKASANSARVLKDAKGAASAATKKHNSSGVRPVVESTSGKKCSKRQIVEIESDDEIPDASKKKAKRGGRHTATAQPASNLEFGGAEGQDGSDAGEANFTARPARARGRVATKAPKGTQSGCRPARSYGGA
jgi:hypothetical protein